MRCSSFRDLDYIVDIFIFYIYTWIVIERVTLSNQPIRRRILCTKRQIDLKILHSARKCCSILFFPGRRVLCVPLCQKHILVWFIFALGSVLEWLQFCFTNNPWWWDLLWVMWNTQMATFWCKGEPISVKRSWYLELDSIFSISI